MCNQCVTTARRGADNSDPRKWICGRCGVLLGHPQEGHDCNVWVRDIEMQSPTVPSSAAQASADEQFEEMLNQLETAVSLSVSRCGPQWDAEIETIRTALLALWRGRRATGITVPDEGAVGSPERDLRVIASRLSTDLFEGQIRHSTRWCVERLIDIAAALQSVAGVEGVVYDGHIDYSRTDKRPANVVLLPDDLPKDFRPGTRVRITPLPAEEGK